MDNTNHKGKTLFIIFTLLVTVIMLCPFIYSLVIGLGYSFEKLVNDIALPYILTNTLFMSLTSLIFGAIYVFLASCTISGIKNLILKGLITAVFCIPALIPANIWSYIVTHVLRLVYEPSMILKILAGIVDGLRLSSLAIIASFFIKKTTITESFKCTLFYIALKLILFFSSHMSFITTLYNPVIFQSVDTFDSYIYRNGIIMNQVTLGAALYIVKVILQLIPTGIACVILFKISPDNTETPDIKERNFLPFLSSTVLPAAFIVIAFIFGLSLFPEFFSPVLSGGYLIGAAMAGLSSLIVCLAAIGITMLFRNSGIIGLVCLAIIALISGNAVAIVMALNGVNLLDTFLGATLANLDMIAILTVVFTYITKTKRKLVYDISVFLAGFAVMFGWFWGDTSSSLLIIKSPHLRPISTLARELTFMQRADNVLFTSVPYLALPILVFIIFIIVSGIIRIVTDKNKSDISPETEIEETKTIDFIEI